MTGRAPMLIASLLAMSLTACGFDLGQAVGVVGSGNVKSESRDVHDFDRVVLAGVGTLTITQGSTEALTIQAEDNLLPRIGSGVQGGTLSLAPVPGANIRPTKPIRYDLTVKQLKAVDLSGAGDVNANGLTADQLGVNVSGAGRVTVQRLTASALTVDLSGSGSVTMSGQAARQMVTISGAGRYAADGLATGQTTVEVSGAGSAAVNASDHLKASVSGVGHVTYTGSPVVEKDVSGAGSVSKTG